MGTPTPTQQGQILVLGPPSGKHMVLLATLQSSFPVEVSVTSVSQVFQARQHAQPDLILLVASATTETDMKKSCRQLKGNVGTRHLPVVVISENPTSQERIEWFSAGCIDCIPADIPKDEFIVRLGSHLKTGQYANLLRRTSYDCQEEILSQAARKEKTAETQNNEAAMDYLSHQQRVLAVGLLTGRIAHEINNPLNGIINYAQLIEDRVSPSQGNLKKFARAIMREGLRVSNLVQDLLLVSRDEQQDLREEAILDVVHPTLSIIRATCKKDGISVQLDIPENLPKVVCRSRQIQQVLLHLFIDVQGFLNSRYPDHDTHKILKLSSSLTADESGDWVRTTLEGGSESADPSPMASSSKPGPQAEWENEKSLSICRNILDNQGGRLVVELNTRDKARVHLDLPCHCRF